MSVAMNVSKNKQVLKDQIWFANLPAPTKGKTSVQYGARPVLIVSNNRGNRFSSIVKVVPITSKTKTLLPTHVNLRKEDLGFHNDSVLLCEQEFTIDKEDLIKHLTDLPKNYYEQVDKALFISNQRI